MIPRSPPEELSFAKPREIKVSSFEKVMVSAVVTGQGIQVNIRKCLTGLE
jgi:hypothetical protein